MGIIVYITSVSANKSVKHNQTRIVDILKGKKIDCTIVDISENSDHKDKMREIAKNPTQLPPYITNDDKPCGTFEEFDYANDDGTLDRFLQGKDS